MNVKEFQKKLTELMALAISCDKKLNPTQIHTIFSEKELDEAQMALVYQYLQSQGVAVEGIEKAETKEMQTEEVEKADPLNAEEKEYLEEYRETLSALEKTEEEKQRLWNVLREGNLTIAGELSACYYSYLADLCVKNHKEELFLGDMIQDANLRLLMLLGEGKVQEEKDLFAYMDQMIREILRESDQTKFQDECLVAKVRNLESAVRELTDGEEDEENKFSVEELSVFLDMGVEEIRDVLRLTGDDK